MVVRLILALQFPSVYIPPGVGKTCLVHLICHSQALHNVSSTTGCSVEMKLHDYKGKDYFLEFWDIGGSPNYRNGRAVFYNQIHGIVCARTHYVCMLLLWAAVYVCVHVQIHTLLEKKLRKYLFCIGK